MNETKVADETSEEIDIRYGSNVEPQRPATTSSQPARPIAEADGREHGGEDSESNKGQD
jgi:hypothetical protein